MRAPSAGGGWVAYRKAGLRRRGSGAFASGVSALALLMAGGLEPVWGQNWSNYDAYTQSYTVNYAPGSGVSDGALRVNVEVAGNPLTVQLDTGSRGFWINQRYAPADVTSGVPGYIFYWSSGIAHKGYWAPLEVTFTDAVASGGASATATATVPVLVVTEAVCLPGNWPNACNPNVPLTIGDGFMGIGFDRTGHGTGYGTDVIDPSGPGTSDNLQIVNPFLNLSDMTAGTMRSGYILSEQGITLGLTASNTATGYQGSSSPYAYAQLVPTGTPSVVGAPPDWQVMSGSVVIQGQTYQSQQAVVDIGITNMLLTTNAQSLPGEVTHDGQLYLSSATGTMQVNLLGVPGLVGYSFNVPDPPAGGGLPPGHSTVTPSNVALSPAQEVWWTGETPATLVNTGIYALNAFNYLYDAQGGYIGLQLNGSAETSSAFFQPVISAIGTLSLANGFYTDLPVYLRGDSTVSTSSTAMFAGDVTGPGGLMITGGGVVTLAGAATYDGGTEVAAGTLVITGALAGDVDVDAGASFSNSGNYVGSLVTSGTVTNTGNMVAGVAVLPGGLFTNDGTLLGAVMNAGTVENAGMIAGDVANNGSFINDGVITGTLFNNGTLSGNGTVGTLTMLAGAIVAPGHSIGTVTVTGDLLLDPGAIYVAELGAPGQSDLIAVGGTATIDGAVLELLPDASFAPALGARYTVLEAAGGISGSFTLGASVTALMGTASSALPFLAPAVSSSSDGIALDLVRSAVPFAALAQTPNQSAVAGAADTLPTRDPLAAQIVALLGSDVPSVMNGLSGEAYASAQSVLLDQASYVRGAIQRRLRQAEAGASSGAPGPQLATLMGLTLWAEAYGGLGDFAGSAGVSGVDSTIGGFTGGADADWGDWRTGLAVGYSRSTFDDDGVASSGSSATYDIGLYAGRRFGAAGPGELAVNLGAAYAWHDINMNRSAGLPAGSQSLGADYGGWTGQVFGEVGYPIAYQWAGRDATVEPFAGLVWQRLSTESFTETGGSAALSGEASRFESVNSVLGLRGSVRFTPGGGKPPLVLSAGLGWQHAFGDIIPLQTLAFASGGAGFTVSGVPLARDAALVELGLATAMTETVEIGVSYRGQLASDVTDNAVKATLRWAF